MTMSAARGIAGVVTALYLAAEGFSALDLGILFLCVTATSAVMASLIGLLSDRVGRKPFLIAIPMLAASAAAMYAFDRAPWVLFVFAALGTFGRGAGAGGGSVGPYQPAESALLAESAPGSVRSAVFGRAAFASSLGALFGGLLAALAHPHAHLTAAAATSVYRPAFLAASVLAAGAGLMALGLRERREPGAKGQRRNRIHWPRRSWPMLWRFWVTNGVNGFAIGMIGPFMSYWLYLRYAATPAEIGLLFAAVNLGSLVSTLAAAGIGRRFGTLTAIVAVRAITGVLLVPMVLAPTFWLAGGIYFLRMLAQRVGLPLRQSFTQDVADPGERASMAALSTLSAQGTMAVSQVLAGYLFAEVSLAAPFEVGAVFQCINAGLYAVLFGRPRRKGRAAPLGEPRPANDESSLVAAGPRDGYGQEEGAPGRGEPPRVEETRLGPG
ncbi:MAG: MFS transporter [Candidatus Dormibacteria bacterium]